MQNDKKAIDVIFFESPNYTNHTDYAPRASREIKRRPSYAVVSAKFRPNPTVASVDLDDLKSELASVIAVFDELDMDKSSYTIDSAKLSAGVTRDREGKVKIGITARVLTLIGIEGSAEAATKTGSNELFEIVIKRKTTK